MDCTISYRTIPMRTSVDDAAMNMVSWPFLLPHDFETRFDFSVLAMVRRFNFFPKLDVGPVKWAGPKATPSVAPRRELSSVRDTCKHLWKGWRTSQATGSIFSKTFLITLFKVMSGNGTILWDARCTVTCQISKSNVVKFPVPLETYDPASPVGFLGVSSMWVR